LKCIHLLFDDIGVGADAPRKEFGDLKDRHSDFPKTIEFGQTTSSGLDRLPTIDLVRKNIFDALDAVNHGRSGY
jgi:hypothetical protein